MRFIDLFSGCGGLSLGLAWAGGQGLFAIERDPMAFATFRANFLDWPRGRILPFTWPDWLPQKEWAIDELLNTHSRELSRLQRDKVDVIAGGPPCQGFSFAGRRRPDDPRNQLFKKYLEVVALIKPTAVLLENVPGMAVAHAAAERGASGTAGSYFHKLAGELRALGYDVADEVIDASDFGVPQKRSRLIVVGLLSERFRPADMGLGKTFFERLRADRPAFLRRLNLQVPVSSKQAIGDLTVTREGGDDWPLRDSVDSPERFLELAYDARRARSAFQKLMRSECQITGMDSMRLARHSDEVRSRFEKIIRTCRQGVRMNEEDRAIFKLRKHRVYPMAKDEPAPTITTLPDDVLHYLDPRILTVRECARLQSFPDWFAFKGKYTTGGALRVRECPRYTQVGNAVPPLLSFALARALLSMFESHLHEGNQGCSGVELVEALRVA